MFNHYLDFLLFNYGLLAVFAISVLVKSALFKKEQEKVAIATDEPSNEEPKEKGAGTKRLITQILLYLGMYSVFTLGQQVLLGFVVIVTAIAIYEVLYNLRAGLFAAELQNDKGVSNVLYQFAPASLLLLYAPLKLYLPAFQALVIVLFLTIASLVAIRHVLPYLSRQLFLYTLITTITFVFALLLDLSQFENGTALCLYVFFLVNWSDSSALFFGRLFGRLKIFPRLSPKKTREGVIGAFFTCLILAFVFDHLLGLSLSPYKVTLLGILIPVLSQAGDLLFSAFKREAGIKDYGAVLPGHGGILDRFDSLILCLPIVYFVLLI